MAKASKMHILKGEDGQWYWRLKARNGRVIADGSEGYSARSTALRAAQAVLDAAESAYIVVDD